MYLSWNLLLLIFKIFYWQSKKKNKDKLSFVALSVYSLLTDNSIAWSYNSIFFFNKSIIQYSFHVIVIFVRTNRNTKGKKTNTNSHTINIFFFLCAENCWWKTYKI